MQKNREQRYVENLCEFAIAVSGQAGSSSVLNKIANRSYKARADLLYHFYSPQESKSYKVESQNTTSDLKPYLSQFGSSHHHRARDNQIYENQSIRGDNQTKSG